MCVTLSSERKVWFPFHVETFTDVKIHVSRYSVNSLCQNCFSIRRDCSASLLHYRCKCSVPSKEILHCAIVCFNAHAVAAAGLFNREPWGSSSAEIWETRSDNLSPRTWPLRNPRINWTVVSCSLQQLQQNRRQHNFLLSNPTIANFSGDCEVELAEEGVNELPVQTLWILTISIKSFQNTNKSHIWFK